MQLNFTYSNERDKERGGGYADPNCIVYDMATALFPDEETDPEEPIAIAELDYIEFSQWSY